MVRVGLIGLGFMGRMHLGAYERIEGAEIVAVADEDAKRAGGDLSGGWGNIPGAAQSLDMTKIRGTTNWRDLLEMDEVDMLDICVPTPAHRQMAIECLGSGKHVLCEKPLGRTAGDAQAIADAAGKAKGMFMPAMCIRFWPQWAWLKQAVDDGRFGKVLGARFTRLGGPPAGWYLDGKISGGAALDLHIHDADFVNYVFGKPRAVFSRGYSQHTGCIDHLLTQYIYNDVPLVAAEGGWLDPAFGFSMACVVNFEKATADYHSGRPQPLTISRDGKTEPVEMDGDGYSAELAYFVECINEGKAPSTVTAQDAVDSIRMVEAELQSIETGRIVEIG